MFRQRGVVIGETRRGVEHSRQVGLGGAGWSCETEEGGRLLEVKRKNGRWNQLRKGRLTGETTTGG